MNTIKETRVSKWKKYRTTILENHNIKEAIINSDPEIKKILKQINFDFQELEPQRIFKSEVDKNKSYENEVENYLINELLEQMNKIDNSKPPLQNERDFNSHQYDQTIEEFFPEFMADSNSANTDEKIIQSSFDQAKSHFKNKINIAIDGPSGVGKSSAAKTIAKTLDLIFINTGLMYRAVAFYFLNQNLDLTNEELVSQQLVNINLTILANEQIELNQVNITSQLWTDQISLAASCVAKYQAVRQFCVNIQQKLAQEKPGVVMEGRDIGTVVLPDAQLKIFLVASAQIRAQRRIEQLEAKGEVVDHQQILDNVLKRDETDQSRAIAPLEKALDAIEIDTSNLTLEQVIEQIINLAKTKME